MRRFALRIIVVASSLGALPVLAQAPSQFLGFFVGTWVGKTKYEASAKPLDEPVDSSITATKAVGGRYVQMETSIFIPGHAEESMMLLTFDPPKGLFEAWSFNPYSAGAHTTTGVLSDGGNSLQLNSPGTVLNGDDTAYRETFHVDSRDQFTLTYEIRHNGPAAATPLTGPVQWKSLPPSRKDTWLTVYTSVYKRNKPQS